MCAQHRIMLCLCRLRAVPEYHESRRLDSLNFRCSASRLVEKGERRRGKPFLGVSSINQQQNIEMLTRCSAVCAVLFAPSLPSGFAPQGRAQVRDREYNWSDLLDWDGKHDGGSGDGHELR